MFSGWDPEQKAYTDKSSWQYELDDRGFAKVDPALEHPRSVFQVMKRFYATLHAGDGREHLRVFRRGLHARRRHDHVDRHGGSGRDDHVRPGLDASQPLGAADSRGRDAAIAARQHRPAGRRPERAARPCEYPGRHRLRRGVPQPAGLHPDPESRSPEPRHVPEGGHAGPAPAAVDQLLVEHRPLHGQPAEGVLRHARRRAPTSSRTTTTRSCLWRRAATRTGAGRSCSTTCTAATSKASSASA